MRQQQRRVLVAIMLSAIFFLSSTTLWFYFKQNNMHKMIQPTINVFVAKHFIKLGSKIKPEDIVAKHFPINLISFKPLPYTEIVGKYAKEDILKFMPIEKKELSLIKHLKDVSQPIKTVVKPTHKTNQTIEHLGVDTISVPINMFKNFSSPLHAGDKVDIVTVSPSHNQHGQLIFKTRYVALHVAVKGFLYKHKLVNTFIIHLHDKTHSVVTADSVIMELSPSGIANLLALYYKTQSLDSMRYYSSNGYDGQLWIVKCNGKSNSRFEHTKKMLMLHLTKLHKHRSLHNVKRNHHSVKIVYE